MRKQKQEKTTYRYTVEECNKYDAVLEQVYNSPVLFTLNTENENLTPIITILNQAGFVEHVQGGVGDEFFFKITPTGSQLYRNGSFLGERNYNIQKLQDKKVDFTLKVWAIVASILSGGLMGAITTIICKKIFGC